MAKNTEALGEYINQLSRWGGSKFLWEHNEDSDRVYLYTDGNRYCVVATDSDYLGCVVSSRKSRPGEDWSRGNDLADGKFNDKTWDLILRDIIAYELKSISDYILQREVVGDDNLAQAENQQEVKES